jgi:hypothetical protein
MFRILGSRKTLCDGLTRRDLLQVGTVGFLGLGDWFRLQAGQPAAPAARRRFGQAKSCILLYLFGSPSQHDTFDPKPDAPVEVRGELKSIPTAMPGTRLCELLPKLARVCDRTTIVRSLTHSYPTHGVAYALTATPWESMGISLEESMRLQLNPRDGRHWPFIGSIVNYLETSQGKRPSPVPTNIALPWKLSTRCDRTPGEAGPHGHSLGTSYDPLWVEFEGEGSHRPYYYRQLGDRQSKYENINNPYAGVQLNCRFPLAGMDALSADVTLGRMEDRRGLLHQFDRACRGLDQDAACREFDHHQQRAFSLLTTSRTRQALDIDREPLAVRHKYGMHLFGQATLAARRLVEAGSRFVTVFWDDFGETANAWDTHYAHYPNMRNVLCPGLDQTLSALIEDLEDRGMYDETLVVVTSEHGRGPRLTNSPKSRGGGRGHWSQVYSSLLAGGGIARGRVVGKSDRLGGAVADTPLSPKDILATMYYLLGIDPQTTVPDRLERPLAVAGEGRLRPELLS